MLILKKHQKNAISKFLDSEFGLLVYHLMGSGKTLTALASLQEYSKKYKNCSFMCVLPPSLITHYHDEINKYSIQFDNSSLNYITYGKLLNIDVEKLIQYDVIIFDEAHRLRNTDTKTYSAALRLVEKSKKVLLLSGTPIYNSIHDIFTITYLLSKNDDFINKKKVNNILYEHIEKSFLFFFKKKENANTISKQGIDYITKKIVPFIDYYDGADDTSYPTIEIKEVLVEITTLQYKYYSAIESQIPLFLRMKIWNSLPLNKKELKVLNPFSIALRQILNTVTPYSESNNDITSTSPKLKKLIENINISIKSIIYSNFIEAGIVPISKLLTKNNIQHYVVTGKTKKSDLTEIIKNFNNSNKKNILLMSSCAGEGLDFKNVEMMHILEPHFNNSKINQIIGRTRRLSSHKCLPKNRQRVLVIKYIGVFRKGLKNLFLGKFKAKTIDEILLTYSETKSHIREDFDVLLKQSRSNL